MIRHGFPAGYRSGCRCSECIDAHRKRCKQYQARAYARGGSTTVDATEASVALSALAEQMSLSAIGRSLGTSHTYVAKVIRGEIERIAPERHEAIMRLRGYRPVDTSHVSMIGPRRRLQALHAMGYSWRALAGETGYSLTGLKAVIYGKWDVIEAKHAEAIRDAYDRLSMRLPEGATNQERGGITSARKRASERGWPPPLALDDERIDDPTYAPTGWQYEAPDRGTAMRDLAERGAGITEACRALHISQESLQKWAGNNGLSDVYRKLSAREWSGVNQYADGGAA